MNGERTERQEDNKMNELRVFENSEFGRVRTIDQNGEP